MSERESERSREAFSRAATRLAVRLAALALILWILLSQILCVGVNYGYSMYPSIRDGDLCITYRRSAYAVGDVVAYRENGVRRYGRIVCTPGHEVDFERDVLVIDGQLQRETTTYATPETSATIELPCMVEEGKVFLLNDYREDNTDGRTEGPKSIKELDGKVVLVLRRRGI